MNESRPATPTDESADGEAPESRAGAESADSTSAQIGKHDPWAHRRGEPRVFAFVWTLYLLIALSVSMLWLVSARPTTATAAAYRPATRSMLLLVAAGVVVIWPLIRLSQRAPDARRMRLFVSDVLIVLAPIALMILPMSLLAGWPLAVIGALLAMYSAWTVLVGALIGLALAPAPLPAFGARGAWMLSVLAIAMSAPALAALAGRVGTPLPDVWRMLSPFSAIFEISGSRWSGPPGPLSPREWWALGATALVSLPLWAALWRRENRTRLSDEPLRLR